ncbi:MAG TPA: hypothetical protein VLB84_05870 [Bacteroidia bacterium]|nr:hypothetical protein [Bacteroidia bacterium]
METNTGINSLLQAGNQLIAYPNPVSGESHVFINLKDKKINNMYLEVYNAEG